MTSLNRLAVVGALVLSCSVAVAQPGPGPRRGRMQGPPAACQQMLDDMKASDTRFDEQVKRMNETQGTERIDAIVAALNEQAARHRTMRERMASMPCGAGAR
jgi:hypothetical protein